MIKKFFCTALAVVMLLVTTPMVVSADPNDPIGPGRPGIENPRAVMPAPCDYDVE